MKSSGAFFRLKRVRSNNISRRTKLRWDKTLVLPVLLSGCEIWKMGKNDDKRIDKFQSNYLQRILNVRWQDHISTVEVRVKAIVKPLSIVVRAR